MGVTRLAVAIWARARPHLPIGLSTLALAIVTTSAILDRTGGAPAAPLDDAFIHFQYARSFAELTPLVYSPGAAATPGATSLIWPLFFAPFQALGMRGESIIWLAWLLGWVALGALAHETMRLAEGITRRDTAVAAAAMVLGFGGYAWFAASAMEVVPLAWLLMRVARRAAEWGESDLGANRARRAELALLGLLAPLLRPEAALATLIAALALGLFPRGARRVGALVPLAGLLLPSAVNWVLTGQATSTTALVKWLPFSPYHQGGALFAAVGDNLELLFGTLLDGRLWSAAFVPRGGRYLAWAALPALLALAFVRRVTWRGGLTLAIALGMLVPATYDSFLWNRLRYLWPFAAAWFVALAALADGAGLVLARLRPRWAPLRLVIAGVFVGAFATHLPYAIDDVALSADAIRRQQASLGRWAAAELPEQALIGVNDTGAIAYFSGRRIFDVVGLTTRGEARYWAAGAGSRFEHYERLEPAERPTHFIVYEEWFALPPLLGELMTERVVDATILGGRRMVAHLADYGVLGSGALPASAPGATLIDELDVADLESEAAHGYQLFSATQADNLLGEGWHGERAIADGARRRRSRDQFELEAAPGGWLVARVGSATAGELSVLVDGVTVGVLELDGSAWQEITLELPSTIAAGRRRFEITARAVPFTAMHYWSYR
jgi:hypothetical protein